MYWALSGLGPSFKSISYYWIKDVYKISQVQYGFLITLNTIAMLISVAIYQTFLKQYEMKTLTYAATIIGLAYTSIDLLQIFRYNIEWGVSDMTILIFSSSVLSSV